METEPLYQQPRPPLTGSPHSAPDVPQQSGLRPTDPSRSGALWVGGAGVALLLAAAAVLTAVRWDEIGQSAKLGGLVAITAALLAAGQRFTSGIPMTAQAIFHLGALLIPFDMAAVAILAGRTWQETLLLTSVTSVVAWYGIERGVPSVVLRWAAGIGVIGMAAGIAAVSGVAMAFALAAAAVVAVVLHKPHEAGLWALVAGVLPSAAFAPWPPRIAGTMLDLGFDDTDRWQPLFAGVGSTLVLVAITRFTPRLEIAWSAIAIAATTALIAAGGFASVDGSYVALAMIIVGLEIVAMATERNPMWKQVLGVLVAGAEVVAGALTALIVLAGIGVNAGWWELPTIYGVAASFLAVTWMIADRRRLTEPADWFAGLVIGSDWWVSTIMFPTAVLAAVLAFGSPMAIVSLVAIAMAFWMVATWRTGSAYGALLLVSAAAVAAGQTAPWMELALAATGVAMLSYAARQRVRAKDDFAALLAAFGAMFVWIAAAGSIVGSQASDWPYLMTLMGAWLSSWVLDARTSQPSNVAHYVGRVTAGALALVGLWIDPVVGLAMAASITTLAGMDYLRLVRSGATEGNPALTSYKLVAGAAFGLAGVPVAGLAGLSAVSAGAVLAIAGLVLVGVALASPRITELPLAAAAFVTSGCGLALAFADASMFALALIAVGCSVMLTAVALRDLILAVAGYVALGVGVSLQLAVWNVTWMEPYLVFPALAALFIGYQFHRTGGSSWAAYAPTVALMSYVSIAARFSGGPAWHAVIAGALAIAAIIAGGYRKLVGPLVTGTVVLAIVVGYESLGPAALVPTWAWLATGGVILLAAGVALERSDTTPLERGQQIRSVVATEFS